MNDPSHQSHALLNKVKRHLLAFAIMASGIGLRVLLIPILGPDRFPFVTLLGAVVLCSWYCGLLPSIAATLGGLLYVWYGFMAPVHSFALANPKLQLGGMALFCAVAGAIIALGLRTRLAQAPNGCGSLSKRPASGRLIAILGRA